MSNKDQLRYNQLSKQQISNPHLFLESFCRFDTDIESFRIETLHLIRSSCSSNKYGNPEDYHYHYTCLLKLLEAAHIFYRKGKKFSIASNLTLCTPCTVDLSKYYHNLITTHFRNLSHEEIRNTNCFFNDFFSYKTLNDWRRMFSRIVEYAYRTQTIDDVLEDGTEMVIIKEYIEKLIEVIYLIDNTQSVIYIRNATTVN
ncbi:hypothetical protein [Pedobacter caeni]|nr:hypothetical protein [Pedobacter caeni]